MKALQVVRYAAMRKAFWFSWLIGVVLIASILALRWQGQNPEDEHLMGGAVKFLQTSAVRRIDDAISVDASEVSSLEQARGLSGNTWIITGTATIEDIWGRSKQFPYRAELDSLCKMYRRAACWSLEALSIGEWRLSSATPTALGLDGLSQITATNKRPRPTLERGAKAGDPGGPETAAIAPSGTSEAKIRIDPAPAESLSASPSAPPSGPTTGYSGTSVTIPFGPANPEASAASSGRSAGDGDTAPSETMEKPQTGLLDRLLVALGWFENGQPDLSDSTTESEPSDPDLDLGGGGLDPKQHAFAALQTPAGEEEPQVILTLEQTEENIADKVLATSAATSAQQADKKGDAPTPDQQLVFGPSPDLGDKLAALGQREEQGEPAFGAQSSSSKALESTSSQPETVSSKIANKTAEPMDRQEVPADERTQSAAVPETASKGDEQTLFVSERPLSASILDTAVAPETTDAEDQREPLADLPMQSAALIVPPTVASGVDWVQLGSFRVAENAPAVWQHLQRTQAELLGGMPHQIWQQERAGRDTLHLLQIGPLASAKAAKDLCDTLVERRVDCIAVRRKSSLGRAAGSGQEEPAKIASPKSSPPQDAPGSTQRARLASPPKEPASNEPAGAEPAPDDPKQQDATVGPGRSDLYELALALNRRGLVLYRDGNFDEAIRAYDEAIRFDPAFASTYNNRGEVYYRMKEYDQAIRDFTTAIRLAPRYSFAYYNRASTNKLKGDYNQAVLDLAEVIRLTPLHDLAYNDRARALLILGRHEEALHDADRAVSLSPGRSEYLLTHAQILAALGHRSDALGSFEQGLAASDTNGIKRYQEALMRGGYYNGPIDGQYGPATRSALEACIDAGCEVME